MTATSAPALAPTETVPTSASRIRELDGLRGLAIFLVFLCHYVANPAHRQLGFVWDHFLTVLDVGWSGVDLFFVLSGFLIGGILLDARESPRYFRTFYLRRVHRILPIYYGWILLYVLAVIFAVYLYRAPVLIAPSSEVMSSHNLAVVPVYLLFLQNIFYSPTLFQWLWLVVTWSLAVEEQFYLVAPPLIRYLSRRTLLAVLSLTIFVAPILRFISFQYFPQLDHFYQFGMPCRADALSLGILAAIGWRWEPFRAYLREHPRVLQRTTLYLAVGIFSLLWWLVRPPNLMQVILGYSWLAFFFVSLLLLVVSQTDSIPARLARSGWLQRVGTISYCVYIIHFSILQLLHRFILHTEPRVYDWQGVLVTVVAACLTWLIASASWKYFEKPLIRRGHRYSY